MRRRRRLTQLEKDQRKFRKSILSIFRMMDFTHLRTVDVTVNFGGQDGEMDYVFLYENIIIICEDTVGQTNNDHLRTKKFFYQQILNNRNDFLGWLKNNYAEKFENYRTYTNARYKMFYVYIHKFSIDLDTKLLFPNFRFIGNRDLIYFNKLSKIIKKTSRNDFYKFLNLNLNDIGPANAVAGDNTIDTAVILPEESSGFPEGIKIISFLISAKDMMDCAYVLRKENWEVGAELYQRLLIPNKIKNIRKFIAEKQKVFLDNVIVSLPENVTLYRVENNRENIVNQENLDQIENLKMRFPKNINSIGIIDGQHRIFAHYEGTDNYETIISQLREDRHLLATGVLFPQTFREQEKVKIESEIFLQINSTQKKVDPALLQHIESIKDPYSSLGIARKIIVSLNKRAPFLDKFKLYSFETKNIKTPSIIKWGLKDLVDMDIERETLFKYWQKDNKDILLENEFGVEYEALFDEYIQFCVSSISQFFNAVRSNFTDFWILDPSSKLLKVTALTGFLISFRKSLPIYNEVKGYRFYREKISHLTMDFSKDGFTYISSHWNRFGEEVERQCWTH